MTGLEIASSLVDLAAGLREISRDDSADRTAVKKVIGTLRAIYFTPDGTVSLIQQVANGAQPSVEQIATILPEFNDKEWRIVQELQRLDFARLFAEGNLSIKQCRVLEEISWGKKNLRAAIQNFLNEPFTIGNVPSPTQAQRLLEDVRRLNSLIEDAEERLR